MNSSNFLIHRINRKTAESFSYHGIVLDLGCGTAWYRDFILRSADKYIGVDWKNGIHDQSKVDVFADLAEFLPFGDGEIDVAISFQVMEHLPETGKFLSEIRRVLKPGGCVFLTVPFMWHVHEAPHDFYRFTRYGLTYLLGKTGFVDIEIRENTGFWQMWVLKFNYHTTRFAPGPLKLFWSPVWWLGQVLSPMLDRFDVRPQETASYTVIARKS